MTQLFLGEVRQKIFTEPSIKLWCVLIIFHEVLNIRSIAFDVSNVIPSNLRNILPLFLFFFYFNFLLTLIEIELQCFMGFLIIFTQLRC